MYDVVCDLRHFQTNITQPNLNLTKFNTIVTTSIGFQLPRDKEIFGHSQESVSSAAVGFSFERRCREGRRVGWPPRDIPPFPWGSEPQYAQSQPNNGRWSARLCPVLLFGPEMACGISMYVTVYSMLWRSKSTPTSQYWTYQLQVSSLNSCKDITSIHKMSFPNQILTLFRMV
jgi:hypothetical protein